VLEVGRSRSGSPAADAGWGRLAAPPSMCPADAAHELEVSRGQSRLASPECWPPGGADPEHARPV